ncbi:hypothetical protein [Actinokineospora inagensis]|uniref:hypothetical protein n=1 Tax=Actinokineospora inagensis TaxID=103730 RepID=UPI000415A798
MTRVGWPFRRPVHYAETVTVLQRAQGIDMVDEILLSPANTLTGARGGRVERVELTPSSGHGDGVTHTGWPFGRAVQCGEVFAVLQRVQGVGMVEEILLFPANPLTGARGGRLDRVELTPSSLVFSHQHQVTVTG